MATIVGAAQNLGTYLTFSSRNVVRTSTGGIYVVAIDTVADPNAVAVWYSADGVAFAEKDAANRPTSDGAGDNIFGTSVAVDSNDLLHIFYYNYGEGEYDYTTFATATDQWNGGAAAAVTKVADDIDGTTEGRVSITIDSADKPHVAYVDADAIKGVPYKTIFYSNKVVGPGWKVAAELEGFSSSKDCTYADITVNATDIPLIVYLNITDGDITAAKGNQNDANAWIFRDVDTSVSTTSENQPTIAVDSGGNAWIVYEDQDQTVDIAKQSANWTDPWTIISDGDDGWNPSIAIDGLDIYIFYRNPANDDLMYNKYSGGSWAGEDTQEVGSYFYPGSRWAYNNNYSYAASCIDCYGGDPQDFQWSCLSIVAVRRIFITHV